MPPKPGGPGRGEAPGPDGAEVARQIVAIGLGVVAIGVSFGAVAVTSGVPGWMAVALSVFVFAGGAQFMAVSLATAGNPVAAVVAGLLLNARHLPFGLALGDMFRPGRGRMLLGAHLLSDESAALALSLPPGPARRRAYWRLAWVLVFAWNGGTVLGVILVDAVGDPAALGLDAANPASLLALTLPALRHREMRGPVLTGALVCVLTTPFLPAGLPVLLASAGLLLLVPSPFRFRFRPGGRP